MPERPPLFRLHGLPYRSERERHRLYKQARPDKERQKFYSSQRWIKFRRAFLKHNPQCEDCKAKGRETEAVEVHHVRKIVDSPELAFDVLNCRALCKSCHSRRTAKGE